MPGIVPDKAAAESNAEAGWDRSGRVLAALRSNGKGPADILAVDHRHVGGACRFELFGAGRSWLGPVWTMAGGGEVTTAPKPGRRLSDPAVELAEWSYRAREMRITQSALLLRGHRMALLSVLIESRAPLAGDLTVRVSLAPKVVATPMGDRRAMLLGQPEKGGSVQVLPIGLPSLSYPTERGEFRLDQGTLLLTQAVKGRRAWLPLLVSWDPVRRRTRLQWRVLTVSERSRKIGSNRAIAARVAWGREQAYVIYRSLARPGSRAFLGHQTRAGFLVGRFTPDGSVEPILTL
jgi:hypothetical protein